MAFGEMPNGRSWMASVRVSCAALALSLAMLSGSEAAASLVTIYKFKGIANGAAPYRKLAAGAGKNFNSTTYYGGTDNNGTIFRMVRNAAQTAWIQTVIYRFKGGTDGSHPIGDLAIDDEGNLYGTTVEGGLLPPTAPAAAGRSFVSPRTPPRRAGRRQ